MRIIYFSSIRWDYAWHRQQEVVSFLADNGFDIYFIEPFSKKNSIKRIRNNITLVSFFGLKGERTSSLINKINSMISKKTISNLINNDAIIFFDRVHGVDLKALLKRKNYVVYDLIDEITAFGRYPNKKHLLKLEKMLLDRCDLLLSSSNTLLERKKIFVSEKCKKIFIPNGLDISRFEMKGFEDFNKDNFTIGFIGTISKRRIDINLINYIAENFPECIVKLVGPCSRDKIKLNYENIKVLDSVEKDEISNILSTFDIGIIPYNNKSEKMDYVFPKKVFEYLAVGLPVVSTCLKEISFIDFIKTTDNKKDFIKYIKEEVLSNSREKILKRREYVEKFNWNLLLSELSMELNRENE